MAMRGLRPIAEIQYLDYLLYALQILSDDLATLRWRTAGGQKAPVIVRTRGHRLEGIWHSGSPMAGIINLVRGIYVCVPRDRRPGRRLLQHPAALGRPGARGRGAQRLPPRSAKCRPTSATSPSRSACRRCCAEGGDVTVVTYGACCRIALEAAERLAAAGIEVEVIDVQTLLPFDRGGMIVESLRKTNRVLFLDEDVPGGATAYMLQQVLERQGGFDRLDAPPRTLDRAGAPPGLRLGRRLLLQAQPRDRLRGGLRADARIGSRAVSAVLSLSRLSRRAMEPHRRRA